MICRFLILPFLLFTRLTAADAPPFWAVPQVEGDPLFFVQADGEPAAKAMMLFTPDQPPVIRSATLETTYEAGKDYAWKPGSREIVLKADTRIPFKKPADLHPAPNAPHSYKSSRDGKSWMLYGVGRFFHDQQCAAAYPTKDEWKGPRPAAAPEAQLSKLRAKLQAAVPIKLVTLGDSISAGADASGIAGAPPRQPGYPDLVVRGLEVRFGVKVTAKNLSVGGMDSAWGLLQLPAVLTESPDLVILAFGMNDASGHRTAEAFAGIIQKTVAQIQTARPDCAVLLVSPMTANAEWIHSAPDLYPAYAAALEKLAGPGVALADVTAVWTAVAERKSYLSLSGNGLNHPNDFGHRLYADVVLAVIGDKK